VAAPCSRSTTSARVLINCCLATGEASAVPEIEAALERALTAGQTAPLVGWIDHREGRVAVAPPEERVRFGRRADDAAVGTKALKVEPANEKARRGLAGIELDQRNLKLLNDADALIREGRIDAVMLVGRVHRPSVSRNPRHAPPRTHLAGRARP